MKFTHRMLSRSLYDFCTWIPLALAYKVDGCLSLFHIFWCSFFSLSGILKLSVNVINIVHNIHSTMAFTGRIKTQAIHMCIFRVSRLSVVKFSANETEIYSTEDIKINCRWRILASILRDICVWISSMFGHSCARTHALVCWFFCLTSAQ